MQRIILSGVAVVLCSFPTFGTMSVGQRQAHLDWMLTNLPAAPDWNEWQRRTGELPPDYDALPRANFLPDPFHFADGRRVNVPADRPARRAEIRRLFEKRAIGSIPPKPKLEHSVQLDETRGAGYVTHSVRLEFGPGRKATAQVTVTIPDGAIARHSIRGLSYEPELAFDASLMQQGKNVLKRIVPAGPVNSGVICDHVRAELDESQPPPTRN